MASKKPKLSAPPARTLAIDIGGTGIKMIVLDPEGHPVNDRARELTPHPAAPRNVIEVIRGMVPKQPEFDRVSVGFPGVVVRGVVRTAPNLDTKLWAGHDLQTEIHAITNKPVRVINDADLQGYGVIRGEGVELVLTLGTGLGAALFVDGHLVPNLELGHHPFRKGETYEERVSNAERKRIGNKRWGKRVHRVLEQLEPIFNYDALYIGGGNARKLDHDMPKNVHIFENVEGLAGGIRLWADRRVS